MKGICLKVEIAQSELSDLGCGDHVLRSPSAL